MKPKRQVTVRTIQTAIQNFLSWNNFDNTSKYDLFLVLGKDTTYLIGRKIEFSSQVEGKIFLDHFEAGIWI